jgi:hypothetical protein
MRNRPRFYKLVNEAVLPYLPVILRRLLPDGKVQGHEFVARNPLRSDNRLGSFKINLYNSKWADFAMKDATGGDVISLVAYLQRVNQHEASKQLLKLIGKEIESCQ